ncbi:hypothetical protein BHU72_10140 [Desulfuribacillus stibiiarsenatis]|uniref:1-acyl-sn-glycerol-3-phosphate acyltransferase n=1 Tax=Desulfuribacillus stibiiarsenatis TaxID=1390249 RepID=A0A1E5L976_9FIRM|nr:lysophospholipid acyltransferase family protein [Desulfuribacillus stibiiarsenatis]OEH86608.1 hypothetical protein BHU72_10140 [Desulfuribacillus stibiiarsenatis]
MFRTIAYAIKVSLYMVYTFFQSIRYERLGKAGKTQEQKEYLSYVARSWAKYLIHTTGSRVQVEGLEHVPDGPCLIISNHQSNFDIPLLISSLEKPIGFIAKKELENIPLLSVWMRRFECIFIDRSNNRQSVKALADAVKTLQAGSSLVIFPEGTRSKGSGLGVFKKGSLRLAEKSGVPIVPITINGTYKMLEGNQPVRIQAADVKVKISPPIVMDQLSEEQRENLLEDIKVLIESNLLELRNSEIQKFTF